MERDIVVMINIRKQIFYMRDCEGGRIYIYVSHKNQQKLE